MARLGLEVKTSDSKFNLPFTHMLPRTNSHSFEGCPTLRRTDGKG